MNQTTSKTLRILSIAPSARGFGYAVMEGDLILECGNKGTKGNKNIRAISKIEKLMKQFLPGVLVLQDVNAKGSHRAPRIKALHRQIIELTANRKIKVSLLSGNLLREALLGDVKATKHEMAEMLAQKYPGELAAKLPAKRKTWESENGRMDIFDAVALVAVFRLGGNKHRS